jgi:hypothetical protein
VDYKFSGFLAPLNSTLAMALNRTVPIKFQLTDGNGKYITSLSAVVSLQVLNAQGQNVLTNAGSTTLRCDATAKQFIANWQTKGLTAGTYTVTLALADGTIYKKAVQLSANGSSGALLVDGTSTATTAVGALLGGDIDLYVDNSNGDLTADELARIEDAVTGVDAVTAPYGVAVTEVTDPTQADVTLTMDTTSAVGGYADGVLGCTTDAGQITIITGWNFYAGSDTTLIGSGQYDFETIVTHELGHALGLGHSTDSTSVMYATLDSGAVNRSLTVADLNVPDADTGGACGLHAAVPTLSESSITITPGKDGTVNASAPSTAMSFHPSSAQGLVFASSLNKASAMAEPSTSLLSSSVGEESLSRLLMGAGDALRSLSDLANPRDPFFAGFENDGVSGLRPVPAQKDDTATSEARDIAILDGLDYPFSAAAHRGNDRLDQLYKEADSDGFWSAAFASAESPLVGHTMIENGLTDASLALAGALGGM